MLALALPASVSAAEPTTRIIVQREPGLTRAEQQDIRADVDATLVERMATPRMEVVEVPRDELTAALAELRRDPDVAGVQRDGIVRAFQVDPYLDDLWGFKNSGQTVYRFGDGGDIEEYEPVVGADMRVLDAWGVIAAAELQLGEGHTVAVVDSGVKADHEDLSGVPAGYDWVDEDANAADPRGHGTHVAGTIAAGLDNGLGGAGVAPKARLLPLRVLDATGTGHVSDIIDAFDFAGEQGIRVVNASLGATGDQPLMQEVIDSHRGTLFVAAAGNEGIDVDAPGNATYPCAFDLPNVLCVGASDARDEKPAWSNFGATSVDVFAPGEGIISTEIIPGGYAISSGTSTAAPHVSGLAALLLTRNPSLEPADLKDAIIGEDETDPLTGFAGRRANAFKALESVPADRDGDGTGDDTDNCPDVANADQADGDLDTLGDACEEDAEAPNPDGDSVAGDDDDCPYESGAGMASGCPGLAQDSNGDGLPDTFDDDGDGVRNAVDNCPTLQTGNIADGDNDGIGDACDDDWDNDLDKNPIDNCPLNYNPTQADLDRDRKGDACDTDIDGDGRQNTFDGCPRTAAFTADGCPAKPSGPVDRDRDGHIDASDGCPNEPALTLDGCPLPAVTALAAKSRRRRAMITVRTSRAATVKITIQRKGKRRWLRVARTTRATSATNRARLRTKRLRKGRYRAVVVLSSSAGRTTAVIRRFRVR